MEYVRGQLVRRDPARRGRARRRARRCRSSPRPAAASTTRTATASCTATSSPATCCARDDGVVKLADFGIAKAVSDESAITQVGSVLGTAAYLAPEQARGEQAGPAADLYALGVVTYQLLSGRLPYEAQSLTELALKQQREVPPRLDELNPDVPPQLAVAVDRALALDPRDRYAGRRRDARRADRRRARRRRRADDDDARSRRRRTRPARCGRATGADRRRRAPAHAAAPAPASRARRVAAPAPRPRPRDGRARAAAGRAGRRPPASAAARRVCADARWPLARSLVLRRRGVRDRARSSRRRTRRDAVTAARRSSTDAGRRRRGRLEQSQHARSTTNTR